VPYGHPFYEKMELKELTTADRLFLTFFDLFLSVGNRIEKISTNQ
jgi:hypothetical protein